MTAALRSIAFLFDVDNTLLDNDRVRRDLVAAIDRTVGPERGAPSRTSRGWANELVHTHVPDGE